MNQKKILILTGLTGSGKTKLLKDIVKNCGQPVNIICGDIQQAYSNFPVLTNSPLNDKKENFDEFLKKHNSRANLYSAFDLRSDTFNAFEYGNMIKEALMDDHLNVIEGGSAFYLHYLRTMIIKEPLLATFILYFNHMDIIKILTERSKQMFMDGALKEIWQYHKKNIEPGESELRLTPIGYDDLLECAKYLEAFDPDQTAKALLSVKPKLLNCYKEFIRKQRRYSTTQLKYLRKYFSADGDYWLNVSTDGPLVTYDKLMNLVASQKKKEGGRDWGIRENTKFYQISIEDLLNENVREGFSNQEVSTLLAGINVRLAAEFVTRAERYRSKPKKLTRI